MIMINNMINGYDNFNNSTVPASAIDMVIRRQELDFFCVVFELL